MNNTKYLIIVLLSAYPIAEQASQLPRSSTGNASSSQAISYPQLSFDALQTLPDNDNGYSKNQRLIDWRLSVLPTPSDSGPSSSDQLEQALTDDLMIPLYNNLDDFRPISPTNHNQPVPVNSSNRLFDISRNMPSPVEFNIDTKSHPEYCHELIGMGNEMDQRNKENTILLIRLVAKQLHIMSLVEELEVDLNRTDSEMKIVSNVIQDAQKTIEKNNKIIEVSRRRLSGETGFLSKVLMYLVFKKPSEEELLSTPLIKKLRIILPQSRQLHSELSSSLERTIAIENLLKNAQDNLLKEPIMLI